MFQLRFSSSVSVGFSSVNPCCCCSFFCFSQFQLLLHSLLILFLPSLLSLQAFSMKLFIERSLLLLASPQKNTLFLSKLSKALPLTLQLPFVRLSVCQVVGLSPVVKPRILHIRQFTPTPGMRLPLPECGKSSKWQVKGQL